MKPLSVAFVIDCLKPGAGTENQLALLLEHFDRSHIEPHLVCLVDDPALPRERIQCPVHILHGRAVFSPRGLKNVLAVRDLARRHQWSALVTFFRDGNIVGTLGGRLAGVPVVSSRRNLGRGYWHTSRELALLRWLNRWTAGFLSNSQAVLDYTVRTEGVDPGKIHVIPNAVSPETDQAPASALPVASGDPVIGCVANLRPIKGHHTLVRAFARVRKTLPSAALVLVGEGSERKALQALSEELGCASGVHFLGAVSHPSRLFPRFRLAVLPSLGESSSNSLLEYLHAGLPVVATDVGGNGELVRHEETGLLVKPEEPDAMAEAILRLIEDSELARRLGDNASRSVERNHNVNRVTGLWVEHLRRFAANGGA